MQTKLTEEKKKAYREEIYYAFLRLRTLSYNAFFGDWNDKSLLEKRKKAVGYIYSLTDAMHNLAEFSAKDFEGFDEKYFRESMKEFEREFGTDLSGVLIQNIKWGVNPEKR